MSGKLKQCPWCRTTGNERLYELTERFDGGHIAYIHCTHCGCRGPSEYNEESAAAAISDARAAWNRRASTDKAPAGATGG